MSDFKPGEIVRATVEGRLGSIALGLYYIDVGEGASRGQVEIPADWEGVTVERVAPADWPPRIDDLWRDTGGMIWFARESEVESGAVQMMLSNGVLMDPWTLLEDNGPLALVHREQDKDGGEAG